MRSIERRAMEGTFAEATTVEAIRLQSCVGLRVGCAACYGVQRHARLRGLQLETLS